jgi:Uncharacterized protein involved in outer membrane biogenesis
MDAASTIDGETPKSHARLRKKYLRGIRNGALIMLGVVFAVWLILFVTKGRFLKSPFESVTSSLTGRSVKVGGDFQLYFAPLRIKFLAEELNISNPAWAERPQLFAARRVEARIAPLSLVIGRWRADMLDLDDAQIDLEWDAARKRNTWTFGDGDGEPLEFPRIDRAEVTATRVRYLDPRMPLVAELAVDPILSKDARIGNAVGLRGDGTLRSTPFRVEARLLSPNETANRGGNALELRAWAANNVIDVSGKLPSIADVEGVPLKVAAQGRDLSELLGIIGVTIPQTRRYRLGGQLVKDDEIYRFTNLAGTFGNSDIAGTLTIDNAARLRLDSTMRTKSLDIIDAAPFIGYNPDIVADKGAVAAAAATGAGAQRVLPDASLPVESMQSFDAGLDWKIGTVRSRSVPVQNVALKLELDRGRLALSPLTFSMARGDVASDLIFDTRKRPSAVSYDVRLSSTPLARLLAGYGVAEAGTTGTISGRIDLSGRGDTIHDSLAASSGRIAFVIPKGTLWTRNVQLAELDLGTFAYKMFQDKLKEPVKINCGLVAFTVRDGTAATDPVLIDTSKNVITGRGKFSFDTEAVDLAFRADAKKFSLFSGQSPVGLGGRFASPSLQVLSPELLARAGAGVGLAVVATPLAGLFAFVDVGDAKSAACGPVLEGARASAQRTTKGKPRDDVGSGSGKKKD